MKERLYGEVSRLTETKIAENQRFQDGGEGWIRTSVRLRGQIYSLLPLTTRPPLQGAGRRAHVASRCICVNAGVSEELSPVALLRRSSHRPVLGLALLSPRSAGASRALQNSTISQMVKFWSG